MPAGRGFSFKPSTLVMIWRWAFFGSSASSSTAVLRNSTVYATLEDHSPSRFFTFSTGTRTLFFGFARGLPSDFDVDRVLKELKQTEILHRNESGDILAPPLDKYPARAIPDLVDKIREPVPCRCRFNLDHVAS